MNRLLLLGIVAFLAVVVGLVVSTDNAALAYHGCYGCYGGCGGCYGGYGCYGSGWGCGGSTWGCYGGYGGGCCGCCGSYDSPGGYDGMGPRKDGKEKVPPPDGKKAEAKPLGFRSVSFVR